MRSAVQFLREEEDKRILAECLVAMDKWLDKKLRKRDYRAWKEKHKNDKPCTIEQ